jgi:hypothetical protein
MALRHGRMTTPQMEARRSISAYTEAISVLAAFAQVG